MPESTAGLKIYIDSRDVKNAKTDLDNLSKSSSNAEKSTTSLSSTLKVSLAASAALAATALYKAASAGVTFNKSMEDSAAGLSALTVATSSNISAMGKHLSITEKYNLAIAESKKTVQQLNAINAETPHSLEDTTKIYKSMYASMKNAGASNEQMIHLTKQLSIAAGSAGIEINSLLSGVDGLANGTVETASDFGRFMSSLGLTNEELKKSTNVVELLQSKLGEFKVLDTMTVAVSNFDNAWSQLTGTLTKDIFSSAKDDINTFTAFLVRANDKLSDYKANIENISDIHKIETADVAIRELSQLVAKYDDLKESGIGLFQSTENYNAELKNQEFLINSLTKKLERLQETKDVLVAKEKDPVLTYEKWLKDEEKKALKTKSNAELAKDFEKRKQEEDKKNESKKEEAAKKAIKAEEDRLKKSHEIAQSQLKMIQDESDKKIKLQEDYQNTLNDIVQKNDSEKLDGLAKEAFDTFAHYDSLIEKYKEVAGAESALRAMQTMAIDTIIEKQKELDEAYNNKTAIDSLDEIYGRYEKLIDAQIELAENGMNIDFDFGDGAKELNNIFKATQQLHLGSLKYTKQDMKMQEDFAKNFLEAKGDELKEKELIANFDEDNAKLKEAQSNAEMAAYSSLAGAMVGAFEKGSAGAIAFTTLQSALGIASSWAAIANAWALPFPANIPAVAMVASAVMPIISQLGGSGGSGGGGAPTTSTGFSFDQNREQTEGTYEPMTDRLDRQIELLESIDRQGSASQLGIELASTSFERDTKIWVEDVLEKARQGMANSAMSAAQTAAVDVQAQQATGLDIWKTSGSTIGYDEAVLREGTNLIKTLIAMSEESLYTGTLYQAAALEAGYSWANMMTFVNIEIEKDINEYQNLVSEWSLSVIDSMEDLKDAASDFKGYYDDITGSMYYETARLNEAFSDVDKLKGTASFADYLKTSIDDIKALESFFTEDVFNLLMSNDTADIEAQIAAVEELGRVTGETFDGGAKDALNYLESIELVAEAMTTSRENIESFRDSLLTDEQLAQNLASSLGVGLATSVDGLASLFYTLSEDMDGLTDADLDLLNANKALLENTDEYQSEIDSLNESLTSVTSSIGTLDGALGTIESTIEKLRAASRTSEQSLQIYYDAIAEAQRLSTTNLYEDYAKAVSKASTATSALFETSNFTSQRDMDFAQLVAANQFEGLQDITLTEIDYLKQIEVNTRTQIDVLVAAMDSLGANINSSLSALLKQYEKESTTAFKDPIAAAYESILGRAPDKGGYDYWASDIASGSGGTTSSNIGIAVGAAAATNGEISRADYVTQLYTQGLGRTPTTAEVNYWAKTSETPLTELASTFKSLDPKFQSFAVGTPNVPYDMIAQIHKNEMIVPETINQGIQNGNVVIGQNNTDLLVRELNNLNQKQNAIITILQESQNIQNINLQKLTLIEAAN